MAGSTPQGDLVPVLAPLGRGPSSSACQGGAPPAQGVPGGGRPPRPAQTPARAFDPPPRRPPPPSVPLYRRSSPVRPPLRPTSTLAAARGAPSAQGVPDGGRPPRPAQTVRVFEPPPRRPPAPSVPLYRRPSPVRPPLRPTSTLRPRRRPVDQAGTREDCSTTSTEPANEDLSAPTPSTGHAAAKDLMPAASGVPDDRNPAASFNVDILIEILSRLPVRSVCRFKCVSRSWCDLITHPDHRKKLPQTLVGFFYSSYNRDRFPVRAHHFTNVSGNGEPFIFPSFSFLSVSSSDLFLLDCCDGLLLCRCYKPGENEVDGHWPFHYVVCNPATKKWVMLPEASWASGEYRRVARLCFDATVSSHFHVIKYVGDEDDYVLGVEIYSSKTGSWSFMESRWGDVILCDNMFGDRRSVFLNGFLHSPTISDAIVAVDMEGKTWRKIPTPSDYMCGFLYRAQDHLYFIHNVEYSIKLDILTLEDYGTDEWILKHTVSTLDLFRGMGLRYNDYQVIAIHPEGNMIFFVFGSDRTLMAYVMDRGEVHVIRNLGHDCSDPYLPYVPLFSEAPVDRQLKLSSAGAAPHCFTAA